MSIRLGIGDKARDVQDVVPHNQDRIRTTFAASTAANTVDPNLMNVVGAPGAGIGFQQTGGNLVITSGTNANAELILRGTTPVRGAIEFRWQAILSQRIINNTFIAELVDVVGDNLDLTVSSATSITVTFPEGRNPFRATSIGQSLSIGAITVAGGIPGRYAIASVSNDTLTLTVSGWPATGSGTCSLYGWNFYRCSYSGTTATNTFFDTGRRGWASGDTTATINTTASPGHMGIIAFESGSVAFLDQLVASGFGVQATQRASRVVNLPDEEADLYLQIRVVNGSTAPASSTTLTVGMTEIAYLVESAVSVAISGVRVQSQGSGLPVDIVRSATALSVTDNSTIGFAESSTALGASATYTGTGRDAGSAFTTTGSRYASFNAYAFSDQAGTIRIEFSQDASTWRRATADTALAANTPVILSVPVVTRYARMVFVNGTTAQTIFLCASSFTAA